jgi:hypothetical protein
MSITEAALKNHEELWPDYKSRSHANRSGTD